MAKKIKEKKIKEKKQRETFSQFIKRYTTVITVLLMIAILVVFSILWVTVTEKATNVSLDILYGNESTLLFGLMFIVLGSLFYSSNLKKFYPIRWITSITLYFIGTILVNSIPVLVMGLLVVSLMVAQLFYNIDTFKNYFIDLKKKSESKKATSTNE